jgi:predicted flap endonuclease-1-like 5' DNA nuclease
MSLLFRIVYAAHANGTHHKLALDALQQLRSSDAERWRNLLLKHVSEYLDGSKAPDNSFKDFKNHVLHVRDNYWGGAPEKVQEWYGKLVSTLSAQSWSEAAYAAGVLSHYYTDPIHPFHTGQTEAENNIHRACEWSINRAYDSLRRLADELHPAIEVTVPTGADWLKQMTCDGAELSNRSYEKLIAHYDIHRGVSDPPSGLDATARNLVAELIAYASAGFARILDRAFAESGQAAPDVPLTLDTLMAALKIPRKMLEKRLTNTADRETVRRMYDELEATGTVDHNLPEDDRTVRDLHAAEVLAPRAIALAQARASRLAEPPSPPLAPPVETRVVSSEPRAEKLADIVTRPPVAIRPAPEIKSEPPSGSPRTYLAASDDLEAAPSIGPKTAARLAAIGITTVGQFLEHEPGEMASLLGERFLTTQVLSEWQDQARLVMSVPGLRGTHAQFLVGAGYRDANAIIAADAGKLCADVLHFAGSTNGQRLLRDGDPPDIEKIRGWIALAQNGAKAA